MEKEDFFGFFYHHLELLGAGLNAQDDCS